MTARCAVLGSPIAHSLSPALHRAAYAELGLDWRYDAVEVDEAGLAGFLDGLGEEWRGLSLTMPLKRALLEWADARGVVMSDVARSAGAGNTLVLGGRPLVDNTDVPGAVAALREHGVTAVDTAAVLGGGATATSVLLALAELGCERAHLHVRDEARARPTLDAVASHPGAPRVEVRPLTQPLDDAVGIVMSTIPATAQTAELVAGAAGADVLFDVVYDPWPTPLAAAALAAGRTVVSGLDLLVHQAALQVRLMTGAPTVPVAAMRRAGENALRQRSGR